MRLLRLLVGLAVLTLVSTSDALACSCPSSGRPCQNAFQVDVVFAGTARNVPLPTTTYRHFGRAKGVSRAEPSRKRQRHGPGPGHVDR